MLCGGVELSKIAIVVLQIASLGGELALALAHRHLDSPKRAAAASFPPSSKPVLNGFSLFDAANPLSRLPPKSDLADTAAIVGVNRARAQGSREGH